jgi:hypothetical protein
MSLLKNCSRLLYQPLVCLLIIMLFTQCSIYKITAKDTSFPENASKSKVVYGWLWGYAQKIEPIDCQGNSIAKFTIKSNIGFQLISVLTLGMIAPIKIEWQCGKDCPDASINSKPTGDPLVKLSPNNTNTKVSF